MIASGAAGLRDSVGRVSSYRVSVGGTTTRVKNFRDARSVVAKAVTDLLENDPDSPAGGAMMANQALTTGAAEHSIAAHGSWSVTVTTRGEPVEITITRRRWW